MNSIKLGKKFQENDYKVDLLADKMDYEYADYNDDYYNEEGYDEPYDIEVNTTFNSLGLRVH